VDIAVGQEVEGGGLSPAQPIVEGVLRRTSVEEDGGSKVLQNIGIPPQHHMASQSRRPPLEAVTQFCNEIV
jgi:hypothetical protein